MNIRTFLAAASAVILSACSVVDSTEYCVETRYGSVVTQKVTEGLTPTLTTKLTCMPLTQQQYPGSLTTGEDAKAETVEFLTRDSVMMKADIAINWRYVDAFSAFKERRSHDAVLSQIANVVRSGARDAGATIGLPDLMGTNRAGLEEKFREAFNRQLPDYATVDKVFIRAIVIPQNIQALWTQTIAMSAEQQKAKAAFLTDSLNARRTVLKAEADARKTELENRAMSVSPEALRYKTAQVMAEGMKGICSGASTCIIGGNVADKFMAQPFKE